MYRKAQTLSYDFFISASVFMVVLAVLLFYWTYSSKQIDDTVAKNDMANKLFLATQMWFTDGYPRYWDASNVVQLGLTNDGYLNSTKMNALNATIGYQRALELVGVQGYNVYYRVFNESNPILFEFGRNATSDAGNINKFDRISVLNGSLVTIETLVWR